MQDSTRVRSILREATRDSKNLNILVMGTTHERYEATLANCGHTFYSLDGWKKWAPQYEAIPNNYKIIDYLPLELEIDLILCHVPIGSQLDVAVELGSSLNVPIIRHTHTLPTTTREREHHQQLSQYVAHNSFISEFSMNAWGYSSENCTYINHGLKDGWTENLESPRDDVCMSVVNLWADRDWACGWEMWKHVSKNLPTKVFGDNPGLSKPLAAPELKNEYERSLVFLNTSQNSPVPMALLEAMASGCVVISTNNCMIPEIITHGVDGLLTNDPDEMVRYYNMIIKDKALARTISENARNKIRTFYSSGRFNRDWNNLFERVLNEAKIY